MSADQKPAQGKSTVVVRMREDWLTEIHLPGEDGPVVLGPGDEVEITPSADVVVHRQPPAQHAPTTRATGSVPRFLPRSLGGEADRVSGGGVRLPQGRSDG